MTENDLLLQIIELAHLYNWTVAHFRAGMNRRGEWATAVQGDGAGWPDLVLVKGSRLIFAELKGETGDLSPEQYFWLTDLMSTGAEVYLWTPDMWTEIQGVLTR